MMTVYDVLIDKIDGQIQLISDSLVQGGSKDFPEYRELCGVIRGLATAKREVQDLARKQQDDDDAD
jgi:hypothetical protein